MVTVTIVVGVDHSLINTTKQERSTARIVNARENQGDYGYDECKYNDAGFTAPPPRFCSCVLGQDRYMLKSGDYLVLPSCAEMSHMSVGDQVVVIHCSNGVKTILMFLKYKPRCCTKVHQQTRILHGRQTRSIRTTITYRGLKFRRMSV